MKVDQKRQDQSDPAFNYIFIKINTLIYGNGVSSLHGILDRY